MKHIFTKTQAVSILVQIEQGKREFNPLEPVDIEHLHFTKSCEDIEKNLIQYLGDEVFSAVVEDPTFV